MGNIFYSPNIPDGYTPPEVWEFKPQGGKFGGLNKPTAGPQSEKDLPRGEHALQLYSLGTPNGKRVTILLEALNLKYGIEYDAWHVNILEGEQFGSGFVSANPNSKIPALLHYISKDEEPVRVFETTAIMMYLCELFDTDNVYCPPIGDPKRAECLSWLLWVHGSAPFLGGGFGHFFKYAPLKIKYAIDRYTMEAKRQYDVLERQFSGTDGEGPHKFLCGDDVTIADMACYSWYGSFPYGKDAEIFIDLDKYTHVAAWAKRMEVSMMISLSIDARQHVKAHTNA